MVGPRVPWMDCRSSGARRHARARAVLPALSPVTPERPSSTRAMGGATFAGDKQKFPVGFLPGLHHTGAVAQCCYWGLWVLQGKTKAVLNP